MIPKFILLAYLLDLAIAAPQLLTFNNGKFGVNFGGYHAEAGLGGLLTGNAAHGGLSASAGTPYGQRASAGLGGSVDGNAAGVLYAGAQASPEVGAEALIGGDTGKGGFSGARAFNSGRNVAATKTYIRSGVPNGQVDMVTSGPSDIKPFGVPADSRYDVIQKVRPPKKYLISPNHAGHSSANANANINGHAHAEASAVHSKHLVKRVESSAPSLIPEMNINVGPSIVTSALNIPIGILRSLQESLGDLGVAKQQSYHSNE